MTERCPCGSGETYAACCGPFLDGGELAPTAEALMRSRYTAFARGDASYLVRTWHPRTRPADVTLDVDRRWTGLRIIDTAAGGAEDEAGVVEFEARYADEHGEGVQRERSRFARRAGRWLYLDGEIG